MVLCDDVDAYRRLIRLLLEMEPGFEVVGEAADGLQAIEQCQSAQPDVVVLDVAMPELDGISALPRIRTASPDASVLVLSGFANADLKARATAAGAWRFVEKGIAPQDLIGHLRDACGASATAAC